MRASPRRAAVIFGATGVLALACSPERKGALSVSIGPTLLFPNDILQDTASVTLAVYGDGDGGVGCNSATGLPSGVASTMQPVTTSTLGSCPTTSTAKFCGTLTVTESATPLAFAATAVDTSGATIAYGCTSAVANSATLSVSISLISNAAPAICGDDKIEPGEQCDPPSPPGTTEPVCDSNCRSLEEPLSGGSVSPQGPAFFLWPGPGNPDQEFFAFFTDARGGAGGTANIALRKMGTALESLSTPAALANAILAPNDTTGVLPPTPAAGNQSQPAAEYVLGTYFYVFEDDSFGARAIHMRSFNSSLAGDQPLSSPIVVDGPSLGTSTDAGASDAGGSQRGRRRRRRIRRPFDRARRDGLPLRRVAGRRGTERGADPGTNLRAHRANVRDRDDYQRDIEHEREPPSRGHASRLGRRLGRHDRHQDARHCGQRNTGRPGDPR